MAFSAERVTSLAERFGFDSSETFRMFTIDDNAPANADAAIVFTHPASPQIISSHHDNIWEAIIVGSDSGVTINTDDFTITEVTE